MRSKGKEGRFLKTTLRGKVSARVSKTFINLPRLDPSCSPKETKTTSGRPIHLGVGCFHSIGGGTMRNKHIQYMTNRPLLSAREPAYRPTDKSSRVGKCIQRFFFMNLSGARAVGNKPRSRIPTIQSTFTLTQTKHTSVNSQRLY